MTQGLGPFERALAADVADDAVLAGFYAGRGHQTLWTGQGDRARLAALIWALQGARDHGLPAARYDLEGLRRAAAEARTIGDLGRLEADFSRAFLAYASDLARGAVEPAKADPTIYRPRPEVDPAALLQQMAQSAHPRGFLRDLAPSRPAYAQLMKARITLAETSEVPPAPLVEAKPGDRGKAVLALRIRLQELGYLGRGSLARYDGGLMRAVQRFQRDAGLNVDGTAGASTIAALTEPRDRKLQALTVALERLRWLGQTDLGARHIWVNQPDFTARIIEEGRTTFSTRAVIGKEVPDQRSPEFSDEMEHMVVNPSWGVPRSIIVKEYLPLLRRNPNAVAHLDVVDGNGRVLPRSAVNFAAYSEKSFPFGLRQPPSDGNALGKVKFMFPNEHNIYLHDTPAKNLFGNEVRAYSHGCIRLGQPIDFAMALLAAQSDDPRRLFDEKLDSGRESVLRLDRHVPVHLVYFTAYPDETGRIAYRPDIYGRDGKIFALLADAGLESPGLPD